MNQRMYGEWYSNAIRLDNLYANTPIFDITRQQRRAGQRELEKEMAGMAKRKKLRERKQHKQPAPVITMSDDMLKGKDITI